MRDLFKFYNQEQIDDLVNTIAKHFKIRITNIYIDKYNISTRLYPTDRQVEVTSRGFENALWEFTQELKKYMSNELKEEIDLILDTEKYLKTKSNEKRIDKILKVMEAINDR